MEVGTILFIYKIYKIMCFVSKEFYATEKLALAAKKSFIIADRDITVYKRLERNGYSPYNSFLYQKGFHYYQTGIKFTFSASHNFMTGLYRFTIGRGLHCYSNLKSARFYIYEGEVTVKMIIPKGAKYYKGEQGTLVTDNLIYI